MKQYEKADLAVEKAVADFVKRIEALMTRWPAVPPGFVIESALIRISTEMSRLADDPVFRDCAGPASLMLATRWPTTGTRDLMIG